MFWSVKTQNSEFQNRWYDGWYRFGCEWVRLWVSGWVSEAVSEAGQRGRHLHWVSGRVRSENQPFAMDRRRASRKTQKHKTQNKQNKSKEWVREWKKEWTTSPKASTASKFHFYIFALFCTLALSQFFGFWCSGWRRLWKWKWATESAKGENEKTKRRKGEKEESEKLRNWETARAITPPRSL